MSEALEPLQNLLEQLTSRLAAVEAQVGIQGPTTSTSTTSATTAQIETSPQVEAYDAYVAQTLPPFTSACLKLGDDAVILGGLTERAFKVQRSYLTMASQCKKPSQPNPAHLKELQDCLKEVAALRDNRSSFAHHQNMVNEGLQALGWLCVEPAPKPFIESYIGGSDFWGNKIRVQYKSSNPDQVEFVATFKKLLVDLMDYVKTHHTTGVTWNPKGGDASTYEVSANASVVAPTTSSQASSKKPDTGSLFAGIHSIDQSSGKTAGLRTVTKEMQTWRKEYKADDAKKPTASPVKKTSAVAAKIIAAKVPVCEQTNGNWKIEHQTGPDPVTVKDLNMRQQVYIFGCTNATIILEGKAKNIVLDSCQKTNLIFDNAVSSFEIVNCKKVQAQCKGVVPSIAIDKTDGCLVYVSYEGRSVQFVTSKSSEMNVSFPRDAAGSEMIEKPIPEQFVHKITEDMDISSDVSDLYTH